MSAAYGSDRSALLSGLRTSPTSQQQFHHQQQQQMMGLSAYQQQQMAMAMYQQQMELAQQQAQLEMQLQLESMRLQNLALQEQIMLNQHQAQAQAEYEARANMNSSVYQPPQKSAVGSRFAINQGGVLAERAMARRQQVQPAGYASDEAADYPTARTPTRFSSAPVTTPPHQKHHRRQSSTGSYLSSATSVDPNAPTPALVLSKPGEAFPISSPPLSAQSGTSTASYVSHKHQDSGSSTSTQSSLSSFGQGRTSDGFESPPSDIISFGKPSPPLVVDEKKWKLQQDEATKAGSPKLNPFSSVFVPSSVVTVQSPTEPAPVVTPVAAAPAAVYRPPRSGSPPTSGSPAGRRVVVTGAIPVRQPRGPPSSVEALEAENFNTRMRKRAITAIRALGVRVPSSPGLHADGNGFLEIQGKEYPSNMVSPGLAALMAATKQREERMRVEGY